MSINKLRPGEELTRRRANAVIGSTLQNVVGGNGIQVTRSGNSMQVNLSRRHRGVPPAAVDPASSIAAGTFGTFVYVDGDSYAVGGTLTADGTWRDLDIGHADAKAVLLAVYHSGSANPQFRRVTGAGFAVATQTNAAFPGCGVVVPAAAGVFQYNFGTGDSVTVYVGGYWT